MVLLERERFESCLGHRVRRLFGIGPLVAFVLAYEQARIRTSLTQECIWAALTRTRPVPMSLISNLSRLFGDAFEAQGLQRSFGDVVVSARPDLAQFQCNGAMPAAKQAKKNPREVAQSVIDLLE